MVRNSKQNQKMRRRPVSDTERGWGQTNKYNTYNKYTYTPA